jgi:hypothetical protein
MTVLYGCANRLAARNGGSWPGQGLRNGKLEAAVAKMEDDVAVEESIGAK